MALELVYTSSARGLRPGTSGFCTVAMTRGMPPALVPRLEALGGYRPGPSGDGPVSRSFWRIEMAGRVEHVVAVVGPAPPDHTQRTNKIASYLVLDAQDVSAASAGPAWLLARPSLLRTRWQGEPAWIESPVRVPASGPVGPRACSAWKAAAGDAGWAGAAASAFLRDPSKPIHVVVPASLDAMPLADELIALLPPAARWRATFSSYFIQPVAGVPCSIRFCVDGTPAADAARQSKSMVIDLVRGAGAPPEGRFARMARTGVDEEARAEEPGARAAQSRRPSAIRLEPLAPAAPTPRPTHSLPGSFGAAAPTRLPASDEPGSEPFAFGIPRAPAIAVLAVSLAVMLVVVVLAVRSALHDGSRPVASAPAPAPAPEPEPAPVHEPAPAPGTPRERGPAPEPDSARIGAQEPPAAPEASARPPASPPAPDRPRQAEPPQGPPGSGASGQPSTPEQAPVPVAQPRPQDVGPSPEPTAPGDAATAAELPLTGGIFGVNAEFVRESVGRDSFKWPGTEGVRLTQRPTSAIIRLSPSLESEGFRIDGGEVVHGAWPRFGIRAWIVPGKRVACEVTAPSAPPAQLASAGIDSAVARVLRRCTVEAFAADGTLVATIGFPVWKPNPSPVVVDEPGESVDVADADPVLVQVIELAKEGSGPPVPMLRAEAWVRAGGDAELRASALVTVVARRAGPAPARLELSARTIPDDEFRRRLGELARDGANPGTGRSGLSAEAAELRVQPRDFTFRLRLVLPSGAVTEERILKLAKAKR